MSIMNAIDAQASVNDVNEIVDKINNPDKKDDKKDDKMDVDKDKKK